VQVQAQSSKQKAYIATAIMQTSSEGTMTKDKYTTSSPAAALD